MRLKTVVKLGTVLSVALFCIAVGFYAFARLDVNNRNRDANLFSLVPSDCISVLESNNINALLNELPTLNYEAELKNVQPSGLFTFLLHGLNEYAILNAHGLSSQMSRVVVSMHAPATPRDQVVYLGLGSADKQMLEDMLQEYAPSDFLPKEEVYKGKRIVIYPLGNEEYLASYMDSDFLVVSLQKRLIEKVIDARMDGNSLSDDPVFSQILGQKKSKNLLSLYGRTTDIPFLEAGKECWSEYDFYFNSDVFYMAGETYQTDTSSVSISDTWQATTFYDNDKVLLSTEKDSLVYYMDNVYEEDALNRSLFNQCLANLSKEASLTLVADMSKMANDIASYADCFPSFLWENVYQLTPFIVSAQYSWNGNNLSHIWMFTYKN